MEMEIYPFHYRERFFSIVTEYDLTFQELRGILDHLLEAEAFSDQQEVQESGRLYEFDVHGIHYDVDVNGYEVIIYRRTELGSGPV
jgi:hypothetical protein